MFGFIRSLDLLGKKFQFYINGDTEYKTFLGGITTIVKGIGIILLTWYYGQDLYEMKYPRIITSKGMADNYPYVELNTSVFNFAFRLENEYGVLIDDPSIVTYDMRYVIYKADDLGVWTMALNNSLTVETCSTKHYDNDTLTKFHLNMYKCVENNFTIGGDWGYNLIQLPLFFVRRCNKETERKFNITCKSDEELTNSFNNSYLDLYLQKNLVNPINLKSPIQKTYSYSFKELNITNKNVIKHKVFYSLSNFTTDSGKIFEDISTFSFLEYESTDTDYGLYQLDYGPYVASVEFYVNKYFTNYSRTYIKFSEVLASVGGFISAAFLLIDNLFEIYVRNAYMNFLESKLLSLNTCENTIDNQILYPDDDKQKFEFFEELSNSLILINIGKKYFQHKDRYSTSPINGPNGPYKKKICSAIKSNDQKRRNTLIFNEEIDKIIQHKKFELKEITSSKSERFYYIYIAVS